MDFEVVDADAGDRPKVTCKDLDDEDLRSLYLNTAKATVLSKWRRHRCR